MFYKVLLVILFSILNLYPYPPYFECLPLDHWTRFKQFDSRWEFYFIQQPNLIPPLSQMPGNLCLNDIYFFHLTLSWDPWDYFWTIKWCINLNTISGAWNIFLPITEDLVYGYSSVYTISKHNCSLAMFLFIYSWNNSEKIQ
jgi:hypothetical protein